MRCTNMVHCQCFLRFFRRTALEEVAEYRAFADRPLCKEHAHLLREEDEAEENDDDQEEEEEEDEEEWEDGEIRPPSHAAGGSFRF